MTTKSFSTMPLAAIPWPRPNAGTPSRQGRNGVPDAFLVERAKRFAQGRVWPPEPDRQR